MYMYCTYNDPESRGETGVERERLEIRMYRGEYTYRDRY